METDRLKPSKTNPRGKALGDLTSLAASIKVDGVLQPILVRPIYGKGEEHPVTGKYEIIAGERRWRAAIEAGAPSVPVIVHDVDDVQAQSMQIVENLQREDVHPLAEADAYARIRKNGESAATIAHMVGKPERHVLDRLYLRDLIPKIAEHFRDGEITLTHAMLLSRIPIDAQKRALESGGLFRPDLYGKNTANSVAMLKQWINDHVRVTPETITTTSADLFPEAKKKLAETMTLTEAVGGKAAKKVIAITSVHYVQSDARDPNERTYGPRSWKSAGKNTNCSGAAIGVFAVGTERGEAIDVCIDKTCKAHWASELKERAKRAKSPQGEHDAKQKESDEKYKRDREREDAHVALWKRATPKILEAIIPKVKKGTAAQLGPILIAAVDDHRLSGEFKKRLADEMPSQRTMENVARYAVLLELADGATGWGAHRDFPKVAKSLGVDVAKILAAMKAEEEAAAAAKPKKS
jgi:ParB/RepB/Spo0J family partition protein